jgi:hypothetical protein
LVTKFWSGLVVKTLVCFPSLGFNHWWMCALMYLVQMKFSNIYIMASKPFGWQNWKKKTSIFFYHMAWQKCNQWLHDLERKINFLVWWRGAFTTTKPHFLCYLLWLKNSRNWTPNKMTILAKWLSCFKQALGGSLVMWAWLKVINPCGTHGTCLFWLNN